MRRRQKSLAQRMVLGGGLLFFGLWTILPMYWIVVTALNAGGTPGNPAHWEAHTSPTITIDRP